MVHRMNTVSLYKTVHRMNASRLLWNGDQVQIGSSAGWPMGVHGEGRKAVEREQGIAPTDFVLGDRVLEVKREHLAAHLPMLDKSPRWGLSGGSEGVLH